MDQASGLCGVKTAEGVLYIEQAGDQKRVLVRLEDLEEVLFRSDTEGRDFIQVNFCSGKKILVTDKLIGFKPVALVGLDLAKLPRVVTTPDVLSVFEAIQDALHASEAQPGEVAALKRVFESVVAGAEAVGFDLSVEKSWVRRIPSSVGRCSS